LVISENLVWCQIILEIKQRRFNRSKIKFFTFSISLQDKFVFKRLALVPGMTRGLMHSLRLAPLEWVATWLKRSFVTIFYININLLLVTN